MTDSGFPSTLMFKLPTEMRERAEKELELFRKKFKEDIFGAGGDIQIMMTSRDKWLLEMMAIISAKINFIGDWCNDLHDTLDKES